MSLPIRIALRALLLLSALPVWGGEVEPPVTVVDSSGNDAYAFVNFDDPGQPRVEFEDDDSCDPGSLSCSVSASVDESFSGEIFSGSGRGDGTASYQITLDPDADTYVVATGQGSTSASTGGGLSRLRPRGGVETGAVASGGGGSVGLSFSTTVPIRVVLTTTLAASGLGDGGARLTVNGETLMEADLDPSDGVSDPPTDIDVVVPPGSVHLSIDVNSFAIQCVGCDNGSGDGSFSFTLTLARGPQQVRWVSALGGSWDEASNWDPEQVPGPEDTAVFDLDASYDVAFPAASSRSPRGDLVTCAATRQVRATEVRDGTVNLTGGVDVSTLADSVAEPGLRVGAAGVGGAAKIVQQGGELCSLFASLGHAGAGLGEVEVGAGRWQNEGRLQIGDSGPGRLSVGAAEVFAAEVRVGGRAPGEISLAGPPTGLGITLSAGAVLVGSVDAPEDGVDDAVPAFVNVDAGAVLLTGPALVGLGSGVCVGEPGTPVCAVDADCFSGGTCSAQQFVRVQNGAQWNTLLGATPGAVRIGGGAFTGDDGVERSVRGSGALLIESGGKADLDSLFIANDEAGAGPTEDLSGLSRGVVEVRGEGSELNVTEDVFVGQGGDGNLRILEGAKATVTGSFAGTLVGDPFREQPGFALISAATLETTALFVARRGDVSLTNDAEILAGQVNVEGTLAGRGTVDSDTVVVEPGGRLEANSPQSAEAERSPRGTPPPALAIDGDLVLEAGATLAVRATAPGVCPRVHVTGDAAVAGATLELVFAGGYVPSAGDACEAFSVAGTTTGVFERVEVRGVAEGFVYEMIPSGAGGLAFRALTDATACESGDTDGDGIADCERCDDCIDDDGDGFVDRADPDCAAPADGLGEGLGDPALARCHGALVSAGKLVATKTLKTLQKCADAVQKCRQRKPDDPQCVEKVQAKCAKATAKLDGAKGPGTKAAAKIGKACGGLPIESLLDAAGLGFGAEAGACAAVGVPELTSASDVATCAVRRQQCQAGEWFGALTPRGAELLGDAGVAGAVPCLRSVADGGGSGLGDPKGAGRRAFACQKALGKAGAKLLGAALDAEGRCTGAVLACVQGSPGDAACLAKVGSKCAKEDARLASAEAKLAQTFDKKCGEVGDLLATAGLGFEAAALRCEELSTPPLDSGDAIGQCLVAESVCRAGQLGGAASPRALELLNLVGAQ
ncbi:MAG: hypothetical protein OEP95_01675 [Myxococcales bacterium]|nr:hypothetical protein [Myxococcales bacterium]